jgi:hypothetical protein
VSDTLPAEPAVYEPFELTLAPELFTASVYEYGVAPPFPANVAVPRGATFPVVGEMLRAAVTVTVAVLLLPSESAQVMMSETLPTVPA